MEPTTDDNASFGDLTNLSAEKLQELDTVLTSILASPTARNTYAQIIDGAPIRTPLSDKIADRVKSSQSSYWKRTIVSGRAKPSDNAMQEYEKIRTAFAPQNLRIDLNVRNVLWYRLLLPDVNWHRLLKSIKTHHQVVVNIFCAFWK